MSDRDSFWNELAEHKKAKFNKDRERFMKEANDSNDGGWTVHTEYHWSRTVAGDRLDYWPSRKKWQFKGRISRGDVQQFIKKKEAALQATERKTT